jgi:hypothetical protein
MSRKLDKRIMSLENIRVADSNKRVSGEFQNNDLSFTVYNAFSGQFDGNGNYKVDGAILPQLDIVDNRNYVTSDNPYDAYDNKYFNRYRTIYPGDELVNGKKYIFIVKPNLNIYDACQKDAYFSSILSTKPYILDLLTHSTDEDNHFISFLTDRAMSFSIPDYSVSEYKLDQPFTGFSTSYAGNSNEIRTNQSTQVQFRETANLDITTLFDAWIKYIDLVSYGIVMPYYDYVQSPLRYGVNIIDYATSIYEIITKPDGTEIIYWAKMTGLFPTLIPHSNFQFSPDDKIDNGVEIQFSGGLPETLNPRILGDFNYNAGLFDDEGVGSSESALPNATPNSKGSNIHWVPHSQNFDDVDTTPSGSSIVGCPYITFDERYKVFKLRWRSR